jgi:AcrR family transcriptional regulator
VPAAATEEERLMPRRTDLLTGQPLEDKPVERADAARNRAKVLAAAEALFARADPRTVTMDDIAKKAGVGRATLYRRYPDPAAIATALLDEHERRLQQRILDGPAPLGPGAPPAERLVAFYEAMVDLLEQHLPLTLGAETGLRRYQTGAYGFWRTHVATLLAAAGLEAPDAVLDVLLAPLAPDLFDYLRHHRGQSTADIVAALRVVAERVLAAEAGSTTG